MKINDIEVDAVIIGNGDFPTHAQPETILIMAPYVVCCDGAVDRCVEKGFIPNAIVGDGDSISDTNRQRFKKIFYQSDDQETNDLTKAVNFVLKRGLKSIVILGATGKREDHTLGNISLLIDYMQAGAAVTMMTDHGTFTPCHDTRIFRTEPGQQISIINFNAKGLRGEGLVYPLRDFTNWWQGTLNETTGNRFTVHATGDYLVFRNYLPE